LKSSKGPNSTSFGSGLGELLSICFARDSMDEFQTKSTITTYGSFGLLEQQDFNYEASTKVPSITIICKVMAFAKILL
jgi:iron complex outermembrane receptor protein